MDIFPKGNKQKKKKKGEKEYLYLMDYKADCGLGNQDS